MTPAAAEPQFEIKRTNETPPGESICGIIYGASGTGKTWLFGTAGDRTLIVDTGSGLETLRSPLFRTKVGAVPYEATIIGKERNFDDPAVAFDAVCDILDLGLEKYGDEVDTFIIDDMTALQNFAMNKALEVNLDTKKSQSLTRSRQFDAAVLARQDFGIQMDMVTRALGKYVDIMKERKKHFFVGAHEKHLYRPIKDEKGGIAGEEMYKIYPAFIGKAYPDTICGAFDEIWHTEKVNTGQGVVYRLRVSGSAPSDAQGAVELVAKTRHDGVFDESVVTAPSLLKLYEQIKNSSTKQPKLRGTHVSKVQRGPDSGVGDIVRTPQG